MILNNDSVLESREHAIKDCKEMLSVSLYHKSGDIHGLINKVMAWNLSYQVYRHHYTGPYADTRVYFIDGSC